MNPKEQPPLSEVTSEQVYSKAKKILDVYGRSAESPTILVVPRPSGRPRIKSGRDIPITEVPIVPIQIADREYRLWLRSCDDRPNKHDETLELSVHFQQLPYGLEWVETDNEGQVTSFLYRPTDDSELIHVVEARSNYLPNELQFSWYLSKEYLLKPNDSSSVNEPLLENVPPEIAAPLGDSNEFLLAILDKMQTQLKSKSA